MQHVLRDHMGVKKSDLANEIEEVINRSDTPTYVVDALDSVRQVGNFAAHPMKSKATGEIVDVEPEEAEWLLETLEQLYDHVFVKPAQLKVKRDALNQKLAEMGKPLLKGGPTP